MLCSEDSWKLRRRWCRHVLLCTAPRRVGFTIFMGAAILFAAYEISLLARSVVLPLVQIGITSHHIDQQLKKINGK